MANDGFDFSPGAQIPLQGSGGQAVATNALASAAYRDSDVTEILKANSEWHKSEVKPGESKLFKSDYFKPNLGEAFSRAVQERMLGGGRGALIQSFGTDPQTVVEHCLSANGLRKARDKKLTLVTLVLGVLFLPGLLFWVLAFRLRDFLNKSKDRFFQALGGILLVALGAAAAFFLVAMPLTGPLALYLRASAIAPVIGWLIAKRIAETSVRDLRARWEGLLSGSRRHREDSRSRTQESQRDRARGAAAESGEARGGAAVQRRLLRRSQGHPGDGHTVGRLASRRGAHPRGPRQGDPPVPQLGRRACHP